MAALLCAGMAATQSHAELLVYNTGSSVTTTAGGTLDNNWQISSIPVLPSGYVPTQAAPYQAYVVTSPLPPTYDTSTGPTGTPSSWISFSNPFFYSPDTTGMVTVYTLDFLANVGTYTLNFEADNGTTIYDGSMSPANQIFADGVDGTDGLNQSDFVRWHSVSINVTQAGQNQLNFMIFNQPADTSVLNPTALRVDFSTTYSTAPVPEPSTLALAGLGVVGALVARARRKA